MNKAVSVDLNKISDISSKIVQGIESSKDQIQDIVENIRSDVEYQRRLLAEIKTELNMTIAQVDTLELQSKTAKNHLAAVSGNIKRFNEKDIKEAYEKAFQLMMQLGNMRNQEKSLREKRDQSELSLMKALKNIESAEKVMTQVNVVLTYLKGEVLSRIEGLDKNAEYAIAIKILEAQEDERKRISREIHDGPAQSIANIVMQADICEQIMKKNIQEGMNELQVLKTSVKSALFDIRGIIFDLRPMILDDLGLTKTIETICDKFTEATGIPVEKRLKTEPPSIDAIIKVASMRIIQEILNNIKKHAQAKRVTISLDFGSKYILILVSDDGVGFNVDTVMDKIKNQQKL